MADTGAPWNLPYPLATDLVRDGAQAIEDLAEATATGLSLAGSEGIGPNVVQTIKTDPFTTTSASFTDVTDLDVTITPSSDTSKVLVLVSVSATISDSTSSSGFLTLTDGSNNNLVPAASPGSRTPAFAAGFNSSGSPGVGDMLTFSYVLLHSPATDDPFTYKVRARVLFGATLLVNRDTFDNNDANRPRGASTITVIEVAP